MFFHFIKIVPGRSNLVIRVDCNYGKAQRCIFIIQINNTLFIAL